MESALIYIEHRARRCNDNKITIALLSRLERLKFFMLGGPYYSVFIILHKCCTSLTKKTDLLVSIIGRDVFLCRNARCDYFVVGGAADWRTGYS